MGLPKTGTAVSGPEFFGFAMPEVAACIEGLEGAEECSKYVFRCLRMDSNRKVRSRFSVKRNSSTPVDIEEEVEPHHLEPRIAKRRAATIASQKWLEMGEEESSTSFSQVEEPSSEDDFIDSSSDFERSRTSRKRVTPTSTVKDELSSLPMDTLNEKVIRTEQLL